MLNTSFSPWPSYSKEEADAVSSVILSNKVNYWTGTEGREFEKEFAEYVCVKHAVALSNGTVALDLALQGLGVGVGDEVVTTARTFLATASSIVTSGAKPVFADVDLRTQNITAKSIKPHINSNTKAIIVVHLAGMPADMDDIMKLAEEHNLFVIEDCAQAHGAIYKGRPVGSIGHVGAWSFCQDKIMTTGGEGGMVTTNNTELWKKMWAYKDHGKSYDAVYHKEHEPGFRWLHHSFGTNWRMTEMQAVIGRYQIAKMPEWTAKRNANQLKIWSACKPFSSIRVPITNCKSCPSTTDFCTSTNPCVHAAYKCYVFVELSKLKESWNRDKIISEINELGVPCYSGTCSEIYLEKAFENTNYLPKERLPHAKALGETSIMFLVHPTLTDKEIQQTCEAIDHVFSQAQR